MSISTKVKDSGAWKTLERAWVKESGAWKKIHLLAVNDSGTWKATHRNAISQYAIVNTSDVIDYGVGTHSYTVEQGVRFLKFEMAGGSGGGSGSIGVSWHININGIARAGTNGCSGGSAAKRTTTFEVIPGETYSITVGGAGGGGGGAIINARFGLGGNNVSWTYNGSGSNFYNAAVSSSFSSGTGGNGGLSRVQGPRSIDVIAAGGTGAGAPSGTVQQSKYESSSAGGWVHTGSVSWSSCSNGSLGTSSVAGTEPRMSNESASSLTTSSGSNVSGGGNGTISYPYTSAGSGSSGTNGYVKMSKYT